MGAIDVEMRRHLVQLAEVIGAIQPVQLFGRIGNRTRYQVCFALTSTWSRTSTRFCVSESVVFVPSVVTARDETRGCARTTTLRSTGAHRAAFASVSLEVNG